MKTTDNWFEIYATEHVYGEALRDTERLVASVKGAELAYQAQKAVLSVYPPEKFYLNIRRSAVDGTNDLSPLDAHNLYEILELTEDDVFLAKRSDGYFCTGVVSGEGSIGDVAVFETEEQAKRSFEERK